MQKILVPTDFSDNADYALETACQIAKRAKAQVILMHVIEGVGQSTFGVGGLLVRG